MNPQNNKALFEALAKDRVVRQAVTRESHLMFFYTYFPHYVTYPIAEFQKEIFRITEDAENKLAVIVAFRGSGKSTLVTFSYALWAILGMQQKKFIIIACQTRNQAKQHMVNLKRELESNALLRSDLGPFQEETGEWGTSSLVFTKINARISVISTEQSIRGLRHHQYRPDVLICDDVEDMASVKTYESRQKTYGWLTGEVIPGGDRQTRLIVIGNLLHEDSLIMRLKRDIEEGRREGEFRAFPLLSHSGKCLWPGKYPTESDISAERMKSGNEHAWQREYLLHIVPNEDQVIYPEWIQYYDQLPENRKSYYGVYAGIDLAISEKDTADYTAIVSGLICGYEKTFGVYILPNIINQRMNFPTTVETIKGVSEANKSIYWGKVLVEDVGYQRAAIDQLQHMGISAEGFKVAADKRSRLMTVAAMIQSGKIRFPRKGAESLIRQIVGFGVERHDDLVDAFTILAHHAIDLDRPAPRVIWLGGDDDYNSGEEYDQPINLGSRW